MRKVCSVIFLLLTVAVMAFIFMQSAKDASASISSSHDVSDSIANIIRPENPETDRRPNGGPTSERNRFLLKVHEVIRKAAHMAEFAALSFFAYLSALSLGADKSKKHLLLALPSVLAFSVLYAFFDEWHQTMTPGRSFDFADIGLDSAGAVIGIALALAAYGLFCLVWRRKSKS